MRLKTAARNMHWLHSRLGCQFMKTGLPVHEALRKSLNMNPVEIVAKMMERIAQNARVDDEILCEEGKLEVTRQDSPSKKMDKLEPKNV